MPTAEVPDGVVTWTSTTPAASAGDMAVICESELIVKDAGTPPNVTLLAPVKPLPVRTTRVPPAVLPVAGLAAVMAGTAASV